MLNLAILGFAHGHVEIYAQQMRNRTDARIAWGWDHDSTRGAGRSEAHGCEFCPDLDALLAKKDLDGVIIGVETSMHAVCVEAGARAKKPILLQKPMALSLEDCDIILKAVKDHGVRFSMAWQMRCDPQNIWMRDAVQSGKIGKVFILRRRHGLSTHLWANFEDAWHVKPALNKGMFMDDASHPADLLYWILGKPLSVTAEIDTLLNPKIPDDTGVAIYRFPGGVMGIVECAFSCVYAEDTTTIMGDKGTILQAYGDGPSCGGMPVPAGAKGLRYALLGEAKWHEVEIPSPGNHIERIQGVTQPAIEFFLGQRGPIATAEEGRDNVQMLLAAYESSEKGQRIVLR